MPLSKLENDAVILTGFEPVRLKGALYGKSVEFNNAKKYIKFNSVFHEPGYIYFDQIQIMKMRSTTEMRKKLLWAGLCTLVLIVGIFLFFVRAYLPPWQLEISLKNQSPKEKPIKIQARIELEEADRLGQFCEPNFPVAILYQAPTPDQGHK